MESTCDYASCAEERKPTSDECPDHPSGHRSFFKDETKLEKPTLSMHAKGQAREKFLPKKLW